MVKIGVARCRFKRREARMTLGLERKGGDGEG